MALDLLAPLPVLALNSGSSSLKYGLYAVGASTTEALVCGEAETVEHIADLLAERKVPAPAAIGHRVVHGGRRLRRHCVIDAAVLDELEAAGWIHI